MLGSHTTRFVETVQGEVGSCAVRSNTVEETFFLPFMANFRLANVLFEVESMRIFLDGNEIGRSGFMAG